MLDDNINPGTPCFGEAFQHTFGDTGSRTFSSRAGVPLHTDETSYLERKKERKRVHLSANIKVKDLYDFRLKAACAEPCLTSGEGTITGAIALQSYAIGPRNHWQKIPERCHASSRRTACCSSASWNRNKGVSPSAERSPLLLPL